MFTDSYQMIWLKKLGAKVTKLELAKFSRLRIATR